MRRTNKHHRADCREGDSASALGSLRTDTQKDRAKGDRGSRSLSRHSSVLGAHKGQARLQAAPRVCRPRKASRDEGRDLSGKVRGR